VWGCGRCGQCGGVGSLLTFDIPQTALVATLDTYDFNDLYIFVLFGALQQAVRAVSKMRPKPLILDIAFLIG
jgi:hypothetical protein